MGKKVKRKTRNIQTERAASSDSSRTPLGRPPPEDVNNGTLLVVEKKLCTHILEDAHFDKISSKISSSESVKCKDCREHASEKRGGKGRSKHGKKNGAGSVQKKTELKSVWVCLECGRFSCGGVGFPNIPQTHAFQHYKASRHPCIIQFNNPRLRYCFQCDALIPAEKSVDNIEQKDHLGDIVKAIKGKSLRGSSVDVEDVGSVGDIMKVENAESFALEGNGRYIVRGLQNLGNTCFFNSVMQNLLSMDPLRDHLLKVIQFAGPVTIALKKLFIETSLISNSKNGISPKNLFGCICAKAPQFRGYQQQDSHELLRCLLDRLSIEELALRKSLKTDKDEASSNSCPLWVETIFGGQLSSTVSCVECGHTSIVHEPFLDLSLSIPTKKLSSRKPSVLCRPKKKKLPPKREVRKGGKIQAKEKCDGVQLANTSPGISGNEESSSGPVILPLEEETLDGTSWMDYVEQASDNCDFVSHNHDDSVMQASAEKLVDQTDMTQNNLDSESQVVSASKESAPDLDSSQVNSCKDEIPLQVPDSEAILLPYKEEISNTEDIVTKEAETSSVNSCKDEVPLQVPDSEAILLPYKEEISNTEDIVTKEAETSSSVAGCEPDTGFDGLGDLFNEPESDPNSGSWFGEKNFPENDMLESRFFAGNSTESDADEVDDKGGPVTVDTCLAHFTKAELLLSNEQGWNCENCSKIMQNQVQEEVKESQPTIDLNCQINEGQRSQSSLLDLDENLDRVEQGGDIHSTSISQTPVTQSVRCDGSTNCCKLKIISEDHEHERDVDLTVGTSNSQVDYSCNANESGTTVGDITRAENMDSECSAAAQKSGEGEEVNSESLKVKRDATKKILIYSAPSILTIHLKRFSQDTRGRLSKLSGHVSFEETIDLRPYMDPRSLEKDDDYKYSLIGIVEHSGTMRGGHYVAYIRGDKSRGKREEDNEGSTWYYASDSHIREVSLAEVLRSEAYLLFYGKR